MSSVSLLLESTLVSNFNAVEAFVVEIPATLASKALRYGIELWVATPPNRSVASSSQSSQTIDLSHLPIFVESAL